MSIKSSNVEQKTPKENESSLNEGKTYFVLLVDESPTLTNLRNDHEFIVKEY